MGSWCWKGRSGSIAGTCRRLCGQVGCAGRVSRQGVAWASLFFRPAASRIAAPSAHSSTPRRTRSSMFRRWLWQSAGESDTLHAPVGDVAIVRPRAPQGRSPLAELTALRGVLIVHSAHSQCAVRMVRWDVYCDKARRVVARACGGSRHRCSCTLARE